MGQCSCLSKPTGGEVVIEKRYKYNGFFFSNKISLDQFDEKNVVKIQSHYRGYKSRKDTTNFKLEQYKLRVIEQLHAFIESYSQNSFLQKVTPFQYEEEELEDAMFYHRTFKPATEVIGGGVFVGEW